MPELIEVELYRTLAAARAVGRTVAAVAADDEWYLKGGTTAAELSAALIGDSVRSARRIGKLLLLDIGDAVLGLRFGMTGRLLVDGSAVIDRLEYSSDRDEPAWNRFALTFDDGGRLLVRDPRRLGGVELDPDERRLGPDAATVTRDVLAGVLAGSRAPVKARLLDQARLAGVGNLLVDEMLWRAGLAPQRECRTLDSGAVDRLYAALHETIVELTRRGGSHTGDLHDMRGGGACPKDGTELRRSTVGGRTTWWCPSHQT